MMWVKFRIYTAHSTHVIEAWNSQYQDWRTPSENLQPVGIDLHEAFLTGLVNDSNLLTPLSYSKESSQLEAKCCTVTDCVHRKVSTADHRLFPSCKLWCSCCSSLYPGISGRRLQTSWCWSPWSEDMNDCYQVLVALFRVFWLASNLHRNSAASCLPKYSMQLLHENILAVRFESAKASEDLFIVGDGLGCWSCAFFLWSGLPCAAWAAHFSMTWATLHSGSCTFFLWSGRLKLHIILMIWATLRLCRQTSGHIWQEFANLSLLLTLVWSICDLAWPRSQLPSFIFGFAQLWTCGLPIYDLWQSKVRDFRPQLFSASSAAIAWYQCWASETMRIW